MIYKNNKPFYLKLFFNLYISLQLEFIISLNSRIKLFLKLLLLLHFYSHY